MRTSKKTNKIHTAMSTRSNITVVLRKEDLGKRLAFDHTLVKHPFVVPEKDADHYRDTFLYKDMPSFTVPGILAPKKKGLALTSYCQNDGYLEGVGETLLKDFPDYGSALNLVLLGDTECICAVQDFTRPGNDYRNGVLPSPRRHPDHFPNIHPSDNDPKNDVGGADFHYLFENDRWWVHTKDVNACFNGIMTDHEDISIPLFPAENGWTDLRKALDRYQEHCDRYVVYADSESKVYFRATFMDYEQADAWASEMVHQHDSKSYRVIAHLDDNTIGEGTTLATYENYPNPCDADFPMKLVYITPEKDHHPSRTVTLDDGDEQGYDRKTAGDKLLALLGEINATHYADWDEARKRTADKVYLAKVLPDRQLHPLLQVPAVDFYERITYTLAPLSEETESLEIETYLRDHEADFSEVNESPEGTVIVSVEWGDWKHSHAYLDWLMKRLDYTKIHEAVTEEDGSDCYSADHYFTKSK